MFVNRLIKTLHEDVSALNRGRHSGRPAGPFLFPHANSIDPRITINGGKVPVAAYFLASLTQSVQIDGADSICQFFDFGELSNEEIKSESVTVFEGCSAGLVDLPAPLCWMEHSWNDDNGDSITSGYLFARTDLGISGTEIRCLPRSSVERGLANHKLGIESNARFKDPNHKEYFIWDGIMLRLPERADPENYNAFVHLNTNNSEISPNNLFDPLMSMFGRLDADGIDKREFSAPRKLNRRREAKGLPGIVSHTEVKIRPYRPILGQSGPIEGDYTPKRYHFRRGHVRHFQNGEKTWVRPAFVGDPSNGAVTHTYNVAR